MANDEMSMVKCTVCGALYRWGVDAHKCQSPKDVVAEITAARGSVYGPFFHNAIVSQGIKAAMREFPAPFITPRKWEELPLDVREGLDYIAGKIARIVTGDPEYLDNWDDIAGYATIVAKRIRKTKGL